MTSIPSAYEKEPWMVTLRRCQDEIASLTPTSYYVKCYRAEELSYWLHIPKWMAEDMAALRHAKCLDIGCGYGTLAAYATELSKCEGYCTNPIEGLLLDHVINRYRLAFARNNIELDPFPWSEPFDVIIFTEVLEHLNFNAKPTLRKVRGLLADGGRMYLSTPDASKWGRTFTYYSSYDQLPLPSATDDRPIADDHVWQFDAEELFEVIYAAGLRVVRIDFAPGVAARHFNVTLAKA